MGRNLVSLFKNLRYALEKSILLIVLFYFVYLHANVRTKQLRAHCRQINTQSCTIRAIIFLSKKHSTSRRRNCNASIKCPTNSIWLKKKNGKTQYLF